MASTARQFVRMLMIIIIIKIRYVLNLSAIAAFLCMYIYMSLCDRKTIGQTTNPTYHYYHRMHQFQSAFSFRCVCDINPIKWICFRSFCLFSFQFSIYASLYMAILNGQRNASHDSDINIAWKNEY